MAEDALNKAMNYRTENHGDLEKRSASERLTVSSISSTT